MVTGGVSALHYDKTQLTWKRPSLLSLIYFTLVTFSSAVFSGLYAAEILYSY